MVSWSQFINFLKMKRKLTITPDDEIVLKYVLGFFLKKRKLFLKN